MSCKRGNGFFWITFYPGWKRALAGIEKVVLDVDNADDSSTDSTTAIDSSLWRLDTKEGNLFLILEAIDEGDGGSFDGSTAGASFGCLIQGKGQTAADGVFYTITCRTYHSRTK